MKFLVVLIVTVVTLSQIIVETEYGKVQGTVHESHVAFRGIPFAAQPVGELRWAPTKKATPWAPEVFQATKNGPGCPQRCFLPPGACPTVQSEACLFMNIFAPKSHNGSLPVYVYVHGGNFFQGKPGSALYDGGVFAARANIVLVVVGYRLGSLGFLYEPSKGIVGNFGLMDQQEGLRFVKKNIASFGGNPDLVTLGGQSAGGISTAAHMVIRESQQFFHRAIIESAPFTIPFKRPHSALATASYFFGNISCSDLACVRAKNTEEILEAQTRAGSNMNITEFLHTFIPWTPVVDGSLIEMDLVESIKRGRYHKVPIMVGTVGAEAIPFIYRGFRQELSDLNYIGLLTFIFKREATSVLTLYPPENPGQDKRPILSNLGTDYVFLAIQRLYMREFMKHNPVEMGVYYWHFTHPFSFDGWGPDFAFCRGLPCHGVNCPYGFRSAPEFNEGEVNLANQMIDYYGAFIRTGDPNKAVSGLPSWPRYGSEQNYLHFKIPLQISSRLNEHKANFFDRIGYDFGTGH